MLKECEVRLGAVTEGALGLEGFVLSVDLAVSEHVGGLVGE